MLRLGRLTLCVVSAVVLATAGAGGVAADRPSSNQGPAGAAPQTDTASRLHHVPR